MCGQLIHLVTISLSDILTLTEAIQLNYLPHLKQGPFWPAIRLAKVHGAGATPAQLSLTHVSSLFRLR